MKMDLQSILKHTLFSPTDITFRKMKEFCETPTDAIEIIEFDNLLLHELNNVLPVLKIKIRLGDKFENKNKLAITKSVMEKIRNLVKGRYSRLAMYQTQIALIVCNGMSSTNKPLFHDGGKGIKVKSELSRLKKLLQEKTEIDLGFINPEESDVETVKEFSPKYHIDRIIVKLKDDNGNTESMNMKIYDGSIEESDYNYPISEKVQLDFLFVEALENIFEKFYVNDSYKKENTNHAFCQQFFDYINRQTPLSTHNGISEREILTFFTEIYELTGHKFPKTSDKVELVEKWLKPVRK
ncbi:hypothetical protein [Emticicia fluvialis]|uniref:hypothetical protein n=1 Tax=Emticicia fluvialis TaxID=2974474 RepID=UPI0021660280|nr:hypothetical protein [Emticicia fluvialis]